MRHFWNAAAALDRAVKLEDGRRGPICHPDRLAELFRGGGLDGQGPAPGCAQSHSDERRAALPAALDGSTPLVARAWAVHGSRPVLTFQ